MFLHGSLLVGLSRHQGLTRFTHSLVRVTFTVTGGGTKSVDVLVVGGGAGGSGYFDGSYGIAMAVEQVDCRFSLQTLVFQPIR
jgi:hypothetical protein